MASFDHVNYAIRPNKAVERKIIFSNLTTLSSRLPLADFQYVGLGSMWFVDFNIAHRALGITRMTSLERAGFPYSRALFNQPYNCINVIEGDTSRVLPDLPLGERPAIAWMDYDGTISASVLTDISVLTERCATNSILLVTVNAHKGSLPDKDENGATLGDESRLRRVVGDLLPSPVDPKTFQQRNYPKLICSILQNQFERALVGSGRPEVFIKLFEVIYSDGPPMATVGGILADRALAEGISQLVQSTSWNGIASEPINVPPLTLKEKLTIDRLLPSMAALDTAALDGVGIKLEPEQVEAYRRYYRQYPIFGEFIF